ncbi:MAG: hypothetical protein JJU34_14060 [Lunatimonas sp.]|uniref:hypothetical protein n=1 Tax=Lunatimonas sp. TaxID=2060141 RepID=UPI00263A9E98|nr:hypothetical protein [Lunatimonas sp.]MCC5938398.1 hypothetical protein [Lunatimonas sp.]
MKAYLTCFILLFAASAQAQEGNSLMFRIGIGTYAMHSQKLFQKDFQKGNPIPYGTVHAFPSFPTFGGSMGFGISPSISIGVRAEYASTGGRLHYKDYSGHAVMDQTLSAVQVGPFVQVRANNSPSWPVHLTLFGSAANVVETIQSEVKVGTRLETEKIRLTALNLALRPGIQVGHSVGIFHVLLALEGEIQHANKLTDAQDRYITTSDSKNLVANWGGLRTSLGVGVKF